MEGRCRPYNPKILGGTQPRWDEPLAGANRQNFVKSSKVTPQNRSFNSPVWRVKKASQEENPNPGNQVTVGKRDTLQSEGPFLTWDGTVKELLFDQPQVEKENTRSQGDSPEYDKSSTEVAQWQSLLEALKAPPTNAMPSKQNELLGLMEELERHSTEGTLQAWLLEYMYQLLTEEEDDTVGCCAACEDILANLKTPKKGVKEVKCVHANVTSYREDVKTWLSNQDVHFACLQETHLIPGKMQEAMVSLSTLGYQTWGEPAALTDGGTSGGLMCAAKKHINFRLHSSFTVEGKGCQILIGRFAGRDVAIGNIYLQSGTGPTSPLNSKILGWLAGQLETLPCSWMIMGDWNVDAAEIQQISFGEAVQGEWLVTGQSTIQTGNELDYVLVSASLSSLVQQRVEWKVPFRPHAAVFQSLNWWQGQVPILQIDKQSVNAANPKPLEVKVLMENLTQDEHSVRFAECTAKLESSLGQESSKSRHVRCARQPLLAPQSQGWKWAGGSANLLLRLEVMLNMQEKSSLDPRQWGVVAKIVEGLQGCSFQHEGVLWTEVLGSLKHMADNRQRPTDQLRSHIKTLCTQELNQWQQQRSEDYKQWLQGAVASYLRPLFRSIKKPEQTLVRPFRTLPAEIRPHARRRQWVQVWKPNPGNCIRDSPSRKKLRELATTQARQLGKACVGDLKKVSKAMPKKAPGPDGWTSEFIKDLDEGGMDTLTQEMREWELTGRLPGQVCITLITMLAKNDRVERPIGLTHYAYRAWARTKWKLYEAWATDFGSRAPWDQARKGVSSLDVALARIIRHETARSQKRSGVTLLLDLEAFYENIQQDKVIEQGIQQGFPPIILNAAMDIYQGPRYIEGEGALSAPVRSTKGIIAGCPFAPGLSKLILHPVIEPLWQQSSVRHIDVWLDDIGIDIESQTHEKAAKRGKEVYGEVKQRLAAEGLTLSASKTVFIVTDAKTRKALSGYLGPGDPEIKFQAKDLGVDTSGGGLRRIATARGRQVKAQNRKNKLGSLQVGQVKAQIRIFKGSIMAAGLYGHQAMGVAPKRLKWYRHAMAGLLGRQSLGGTDVILDMQTKEGDPACTILLQHFSSLARIVRNWPAAHRTHLQQAWESTWNALSIKQYPWKTAAGPLGAAVAYLLSLRWQAPTLHSWRQTANQEKPWDISQVKDMHSVLSAMRTQLVQERRQRIAKSYNCQELEGGIDWYGAQQSIKGLGCTKPCHTLWQGALKAGPDAWCGRCDKQCTYQHLLWECDWWKTNLQEPKKFEELRKTYPGAGLWTFGLNPRQIKEELREENLQWEGDWEQVKAAPHKYKWGTDGTAGASKDPRMQCHVWGVAVATVRDQEINVVASVSGRLMGPQTVYRSEARALLFVAEYQRQQVLDVTTDCQAVYKRLQRKSLKGASMDIFERFESSREFIQPLWINSHLEKEPFASKFGAQQEWRRLINVEVDKLVGHRAQSERNVAKENEIKARDAVSRQVNGLLAKRVQALLEYDADQGPTVQWVEKSNKNPKNTQEGSKTRKKGQRLAIPVIKTQVFEKERKLNKRQQLEKALVGGEAAKGHSWQECHRSRDNLTAKCTKCGLYIQQTDKPSSFEAKINQPCWSQPCDVPEGLFHKSHKMKNAGVSWVCLACQCSQNIGGVMPQTLQKQCVFRKRKNDNPAYLLAVAAGDANQGKNSLFGTAPVKKPGKVFQPEHAIGKSKPSKGRQTKLNFQKTFNK